MVGEVEGQSADRAGLPYEAEMGIMFVCWRHYVGNGVSGQGTRVQGFRDRPRIASLALSDS